MNLHLEASHGESGMRVTNGALVCLSFVVACARPGTAGEDAKPSGEGFRLAITAPADDLRAAIAQRAVFDGVGITFLTKESAVVLTRSGTPFGEHDWIVGQLRDLDKALATNAKLRGLSDEELRALFDDLCGVPPVAWVYRLIERDPVLLEIVRRGGDAWRDRVRSRLEKLEEWRKSVEGDSTRSWHAHDLELLTALRRVEGKPDPVRMEVTPPEPCRYPDLPTVELVMTNHDERTVTMTRGGDYRSGREGRYHVEARDAKGRILPSFEWPRWGEGGGLSSRERIEKGQGLGTALPLSRYVAQLDPGEYRMRIHYSDWAGIAEPDGYLGVVTVVSEPFTIRILPRVVETTRAAQATLAALAEELPLRGPVQVLEGRYGEWAYEFVPPDSAAGKLAAAGWQAVPVLVRFAGRADADPMRRAWAFAVLHTITGRLAPTDTKVIGDFHTHAGGFNEVTGGGFSKSSRSVTSPRGSSVDPAAQDELARAWAKIASIVELKESK